MRLTRKEFFDLAARSAAGSVAALSSSGFLGRVEARPLGEGLSSPKGSEAKSAPPSGITEAVVKFVTTADIRTFPDNVVREAKRCLIDGLGVILAGSTVRGSAIVREYVKTVSSKAEASVVGPERLMAPVALAALANGASGHAMDFDDTQLSTSPDRTYGLLTHPTVPALAASLALGERMNSSGADFLEAFLTGFEVECKIAEAIDPNHYTRGFHTSGTIGAFGAAASAAKLLKLNSDAVANAMGITSSLGAGIRVNFGSMTKPLHVGKAAENGVFAAELASRGFTAGADALDGQWGFFQVLGGGAEPDKIVQSLGRPFTIVSPGVSVKPYPCGSLGHPSMDALLKVVVEHDLKPEQIKGIRLRAGSNILGPLRYRTAKTELEAKFCPPFMLASIVIRRGAGIREFTDEFVSSEPVQRMMQRVETVLDPEIEAKGFDKIRSIIEVHLTDGRSYVQPSDDRYRGGPDRPFTREELHQKFTECAELSLPRDRIPQVLELIESIDRLKNLQELTQALAPPVSTKRSTVAG